MQTTHSEPENNSCGGASLDFAALHLKHTDRLAKFSDWHEEQSQSPGFLSGRAFEAGAAAPAFQLGLILPQRQKRFDPKTIVSHLVHFQSAANQGD